MEEITFKSITDLYKRVYPALMTKKNELSYENIITSELELWNYFKDNVWDKSSGLSLHDMVDDILNLDILEFSSNRKINKVDNNDDN